MDRISITFAKIAALKKNFDSLEYHRNSVAAYLVDPLLPKYESLKAEIKSLLPELYSDLPEVSIPSKDGLTYFEGYLTPIVHNLDYILEVRTNYRIDERKNTNPNTEYVFISHGRSQEWYKVQAYIEKDLGYKSIELAQQPNRGRTVLQKLNDESEMCHCAVIVMTGDDLSGEEVRARENVLHEIGFFQGKLGLHNVVLLHEEGVNIPSNIHGLVYIPFPKDAVDATFAVLNRELKVIYE